MIYIYIYTHTHVFSVKTAEEINEKLNGLKLEESIPVRNGTFKEASGFGTPQSVDWRKSGLVSPVQNQASDDFRYFQLKK